MKRVLVIMLFFLFCHLSQAANKDTVRFVYVLQNPKFYGVDKARSWFEIEGLNDQTIKQIINDTLRKAFFNSTGLEPNDTNAIFRPNEITPAGYTDYSFWNGQTYGNGFVRFKDSDSLLKLTRANGYYGSGAMLGEFVQEILDGKLAWIQIHTTRFMNAGIETDRTIELAFDLSNGKTLATQFTVRLDTTKRKQLERRLQEKTEMNFAEYGYYRDEKITGSDRYSDTVIVNMGQLIRWKRGEKDQYANTICRSFDVDGLVVYNNQPAHWKTQTCLNLDESIPFLLEDDWKNLVAL